MWILERIVADFMNSSEDKQFLVTVVAICTVATIIWYFWVMHRLRKYSPLYRNKKGLFSRILKYFRRVA